MKRKLTIIACIAMMLAMLSACGGSDTPSNTESAKDAGSATAAQTSDATETITIDSDESELTALTGTPLTDAMDKISELGYTATYYADGVDFTDFIDDVKDDYTTGEIKANTSAKTVEVTLVLTSNIEASETEKALEEKLNVGTAWVAAEKYGQTEYGSSFDLNYLTGKINASADDESTWFLKAECEVNGQKKTCEAKVTGTTESPEVVLFDVY